MTEHRSLVDAIEELGAAADAGLIGRPTPSSVFSSSPMAA